MAIKQFFTDEEIVLGVKENNDKVIKYLFKEHFTMVSGFVLNNNGSYQEAKDIYQEAFVVFYNNIRSSHFKLECKIKTYLYSVSRRLWLNELKIKSKISNNIYDVEDSIEISEEDQQQIYLQEKQFDLMHKSMIDLGEPCRTILNDFYVEKTSMVEIAEKMGYTNAENAKNQKYKCLQRLKKIFFTNMKTS